MDGSLPCFEEHGIYIRETHQLADQLPAVHERAGIHINAKTAATLWDGGPMDCGMAMDVLMSLPRNVSAETQ